jgi:hypothetical protein
MADQKNNLKIDILGKGYSIVTDEDKKVVEQALEIINSSAVGKTASLDQCSKMAFTMLQIAVDLVKERGLHESDRYKMETLNHSVEEALAEK